MIHVLQHWHIDKPVEFLFQKSHFSPLATMLEDQFHFSTLDNTSDSKSTQYLNEHCCGILEYASKYYGSVSNLQWTVDGTFLVPSPRGECQGHLEVTVAWDHHSPPPTGHRSPIMPWEDNWGRWDEADGRGQSREEALSEDGLVQSESSPPRE